MPTHAQRDPGLETVNKKEVVNAIGNALNHLMASQELQDLIDARIKDALDEKVFPLMFPGTGL